MELCRRHDDGFWFGLVRAGADQRRDSFARRLDAFAAAAAVVKTAMILFAALLAAAPAWAITTDNGSDLAQLIGATTFYDHGFTGTSAIVANIEAGYVWDQQQTLTQDTTELSDSSIVGQFDRHATWVGSLINGRGSSVTDQGIAYGATLWSGAIATSWTGISGYAEDFNYSTSSFATPYLEALVTGVPGAGGQTADVINSSWNDANFGGNGSDPNSIALDALIYQSGKTLVLSAGNSGPTPDTVDSPAAGANAIVVGALQSDSSSPPYDEIASFSSRSPSDLYVPLDPNGYSAIEKRGVRAQVDITAPGTDLTLAYYGGATGGNAFGGPSDTSSNEFESGLAGTSFAAPIVASGAALIVDAGRTLFPSDSNAIDGRVVKAVLMNSADKPVGWNNGQVLKNGVVTTTQSLDYTYGAGILDLNQAYSQYTGGTTDSAGGAVQSTGWAFGQITHHPAQTATVNYSITTPLKAGTDLSATLDWYEDEIATPDPGYGLDTSYGSLDNLDLSVYLASGPQPHLIAQSVSLYNSVQELNILLPADGTYQIVVSETNYVWNFVGDTTTDFGVAWSVPEPAGGALLLLGGLAWIGLRGQRESKRASRSVARA
jgi:Subtilase family